MNDKLGLLVWKYFALIWTINSISDSKCMIFSPHTKQFNSDTWLPRVSIGPHFRCKSQASRTSDWPAINWTTSSGLIIRKAHHRTGGNGTITSLLQRIKFSNSQIDAQGKVLRKGQGTSMPSSLPPAEPNLFTNLEALWMPYVFRGFFGGPLYRHNWLNHRPLVISSISSPSAVVGVKVPIPWFLWWLSHSEAV